MPHLITHTKRQGEGAELGIRRWDIGKGAGKISSNVLVT